jgi:hypothetical protein
MIGVIMGPFLKEDLKDDFNEADSAEDTETTKNF